MKDVRKATASVLALSNQLQRCCGNAERQSDDHECLVPAIGRAGRSSRATTLDAGRFRSDRLDVQESAIDLRQPRAHQRGARFRRASSRHVLAQIDSGQGSIGLLLHDPALYNSVTDAVHQMQGLIDDLQKHPRKYINLSIFGGGGR